MQGWKNLSMINVLIVMRKEEKHEAILSREVQKLFIKEKTDY